MRRGAIFHGFEEGTEKGVRDEAGQLMNNQPDGSLLSLLLFYMETDTASWA